MMGLFRPGWPSIAIYGALILGGFLRSLQFTAYNTIAYADIARERMSAATSLYSTIQQLSLTLGITVGAAALEFATVGLGAGGAVAGRLHGGVRDGGGVQPGGVAAGVPAAGVGRGGDERSPAAGRMR